MAGDPMALLLDEFSSDKFSTDVGGPDCSEPQKSRLSQYKNRNATDLGACQRERRLERLDKQKQARFEHIMQLRELEVPSDNDQKTSIRGDWHRRRSENRYRHQLMINEWLIDIPLADELASKWLVVACPKGKRVLLVAGRTKNHRNTHTVAYRNNGSIFSEFQCDLPGGTILDCVFCQRENTFYVLDCLCWRDTLLADSEHAIKAVPYCECVPGQIETLIKTDFEWETLDGLMFYHRDARYVAGETPLVGWLEPWMLPEILDVPVPEAYLSDPRAITVKDNNQTAREYIASFNENTRDKTMYKKKPQLMQTEESNPEGNSESCTKGDDQCDENA